MTAADVLSPLDLSFLYLESAHTPMHSGSIGIFEGAPLHDAGGELRIEHVHAEVDQPALPRAEAAQAGTAPAARRAGSVVGRRPEFDIANHVRQAALTDPATRPSYSTCCAGPMAPPLDRSRPLWEMWFVDGLDGGSVAVFESSTTPWPTASPASSWRRSCSTSNATPVPHSPARLGPDAGPAQAGRGRRSAREPRPAAGPLLAPRVERPAAPGAGRPRRGALRRPVRQSSRRARRHARLLPQRPDRRPAAVIVRQPHGRPAPRGAALRRHLERPAPAQRSPAACTACWRRGAN